MTEWGLSKSRCALKVKNLVSWWHHQMETLQRYLHFVRGNHRSPVISPHKGALTRSFDVFFNLRQNKRLSKRGWGFDTPSRPLWRHCYGWYYVVAVIAGYSIRRAVCIWCYSYDGMPCVQFMGHLVHESPRPKECRGISCKCHAKRYILY